MASSAEKISKCDILVFFCYELAYSVKVDTLEKLLREQETEGVLSLRRSRSHYLRFESYPLVIKLGDESVELRGKRVSVAIQARVFDFGVVSICFKIPFSGDFNLLAGVAAAISETDRFLVLSRNYLKRIKRLVEPALYRPIESDIVEDYTIFHVSQLDEPLGGQQLLEKRGPEIAMILRAEERPLSAQETASALSNNISYYPDDILVVDWDRAFVYDREEHHDHINIIEFANTHLLDMRYYDNWIDGELDALYRDVRAGNVRTSLITPARYRQLSRRTMQLLTDVAWLVDQIDNSLKAIETLYAARVHRAIGRRLYLEEWKKGLDRKLEALRGVSDVLDAKIFNLRLIALELAIVVLIFVEIIINLT